MLFIPNIRVSILEASRNRNDIKGMAVGDDAMIEGSVSSLLLNSLESSQDAGSLSPEDVAWVDSCLIKDPEVSDSDWNSLKDALLEILNVQPNALGTSGAGNVVFPSRADMEMLPSNDEAENALLPTTDDYPIPINEVEENCDDIPDNQKAHNFRSRAYLGNVFLPSYNEENQRESRNTDLSSLGDEIEPSTDDIFKVWDLEIPAEEDELIQQLNKALTDISSPSIPASFDDLGKWKDLKGELLDDLVSGIADLSLDKKTA